MESLETRSDKDFRKFDYTGKGCTSDYDRSDKISMCTVTGP